MNTVFVLSLNNEPLTPTKPAKARKLLRDGKAEKVWSKTGKFGVRLLEKTREEIPKTVLGVDNGTKFEGYSVVCGTQNLVNVMWKLPKKQTIVKKLEQRREARKTRRSRLRRRPARFNNRKRKPNWLAPSQNVVHLSRIKIISELCKIYPIKEVAIEDVKFNHKKFRWGKNFSTIEVSKQNLRDWFINKGIAITEYSGKDTKGFRDQFGLIKTSGKSDHIFTSHCSDSLAISCGLIGYGVDIGEFMVFDDTYRCVRRRLHYSQFSKGGVKKNYSKGSINGFRKGLVIGGNGFIGILVGLDRECYRYRDINLSLKRVKISVGKVKWMSNKFAKIV